MRFSEEPARSTRAARKSEPLLAAAAGISNKPEGSGLHFHIQISPIEASRLQTSWNPGPTSTYLPRIGMITYQGGRSNGADYTPTCISANYRLDPVLPWRDNGGGMELRDRSIFLLQVSRPSGRPASRMPHELKSPGTWRRDVL